MSKDKKAASPAKEEQYSLNDDRRVKVLSPGALVAKRFFRNRLAVTGLVILILMFAFSFIGGLISPYKQDQKFYRIDSQIKDYAGVQRNDEFSFVGRDNKVFSGAVQAQALRALNGGALEFSYRDADYKIEKLSDDTYTVVQDGGVIGLITKRIASSSTDNKVLPFEFSLGALTAEANAQQTFTADSQTYTLDSESIVYDDSGKEVAFISKYVVRAIMGDVFLSREFKSELIDEIENGAEQFVYTDEDGKTAEYKISYDAAKKMWNIRQETDRTVFDSYADPTKEHWLGTDRNGMDMLTRLMYGGRVSLIIGFIVVFIETILGVIMGGISGYFGGWVDNLIMRIVDIFYCIPSMPLIIILGAIMDQQNLDPSLRMLFLMLILGFLGWPSIARLVRGQILSLREQEFMVATEACGISVGRRIFRHLIPNVIPQLIVTMTMGLGSTIITEATLSFLGLGVRFPFASWGNIINDVNNVFVLTHYWNIWIPAGILLLLTVLAFNIVGDGLRDAFDPKMTR